MTFLGILSYLILLLFLMLVFVMLVWATVAVWRESTPAHDRLRSRIARQDAEIKNLKRSLKGITETHQLLLELLAEREIEKGES